MFNFNGCFQYRKKAIRFSKTKSYDKNIEILINLGSSLGGARPKANVKDDFNNLWIAKFPSHNDDYDVKKFECLLLELARKVNLTVPSFKLTKYSKYGSTLFSKRFDRNKEKRIHYISALTLLNAQDGESSNYSYLDLVSLIKEYSSDPNLDLLELYKRMIFNIITSNTDDHLRNHGFIISEDFKIRLSPLFDLNPVKDSYTHALNIFSDMKEINLDNLINYSKYFNLSKDDGKKISEEINMTIKDSLNTLFKIYSFNRFEKEYINSSLRYIEN